MFERMEFVPTEYLIRELEALADALDYGLSHTLQTYWTAGDGEELLQQTLRQGYREMGPLNLDIVQDWLDAEYVDSERHLGVLPLGGEGGDQ